MITLRVFFNGEGDDLMSKVNISIETAIPEPLGPPPYIVSSNYAGAGIAVIRYLLMDVVNWIRGRFVFPTHHALALSIMGRVISTVTAAWIDEIGESCPAVDPVNATMRLVLSRYCSRKFPLLLTLGSLINIAKPEGADNRMFIVPAQDIIKGVLSEGANCAAGALTEP